MKSFRISSVLALAFVLALPLSALARDTACPANSKPVVSQQRVHTGPVHHAKQPRFHALHLKYKPAN